MMFSKNRQIDPAIRKRLDALGEGIVKAKLSSIANVTSLADQDRLEDLGENVKAPVSAVAQWLDEQDARRQHWVQAAAVLAGLAVVVPLFIWYFPISDRRPELASTAGGIDVQAHPKVAFLHWNNIGTKPARRGIVTFLFSAMGCVRLNWELITSSELAPT